MSADVRIDSPTTVSVKKISILLVDDEALLRQGLHAILEKEPFVKAIYEAGDIEEFRNHVLNQKVDLILLDIKLRNTNGLELLQMVKEMKRQPKVIAVTGMEGVELIVNLLKAGCNGIVHKLDGYREILKTINALLEGENYFPEKILKIIHANAHRWDKVPTVHLTFHEKELVKAIAAGGTTKQIASELRLTIDTAETYRIRLLKKVGVPNTAALLAYVYKNGML